MEADYTGLWIKPDDIKVHKVTLNPKNHENHSSANAEGSPQANQKGSRASAEANSLHELHERYGHISFNTLKSLPEIQEMDIPTKTFKNAECKACIAGKSTKPASTTNPPGPRTTKPLERIHCDLIGPMKKEWLGKSYILTIIDDFSRYCIAIPIRSKSDTTDTLKLAIKQLEVASNHKIQTIQADWGGEFRNNTLAQWCQNKGIKLKETVPHHSETNAVIERLNRTLQDMARTAMIAAGMKGLWGDAIQ